MDTLFTSIIGKTGADALVLLLANQLLVTEVTRCLCCGRAMRPRKSPSLAINIILFIEEFTGGPSIAACGMGNTIHDKHTATSLPTD
ncbi:unnamed protein product [Linum trigynum]|uniref:Secreted protein n=1 Tax=Linum trigynum TaxID=586398 RepID=A0AAV2DI47_9ROSI